MNLPFQEVLTFWGTIETRDVTSHLGDEDVVIPSTYSEVFANPTMLAVLGRSVRQCGGVVRRADRLSRLGEPDRRPVAAARTASLPRWG